MELLSRVFRFHDPQAHDLKPYTPQTKAELKAHVAQDEGSTLVKRFETLVSFATQFGEALGLPRIQRVGENVVIRFVRCRLR